MYDIAIVGGGIAGASLAYFANKNGKRVAIIDKDNLSNSASAAAGAFLSPKFGPKSSYNDFINRAYIYSLDFYKENFPHLLNESGMLRIPRNEEEKLTCKEYASNSIFWKKKENGYFCESVATIKSLPTILEMIKNCDIFLGEEVKSFERKDDIWYINDDIETKHLVLATGANLLINEPYLHVKPIFGQRLEAYTKKGLNYNIHRSCSVSAVNDENIVYIGASHIPSWRYENSEILFDAAKQKLIDEANSLLDDSVEVISEIRGFRSSTLDYFPFVGEVINAKKTLEENRPLYHGLKVKEDKYTYYKNLWIHTGHGARGFVLSPYTAKQLYAQMFNDEIDIEEKEITLGRAIIRYARKIKL
ncbi:MAG: FAD-dependent oxidoreductase [Campylobacteraceae bacterium]